MTPLISCIMPTTGSRKRFVERSIRYFNQQDYPNKELIIVDEHDAYGDCADVVPGDVHYVWMLSDRKMTIGMKRNIACSLAQGDIICHWDDDDYYGPQRLSKQVQPLLSENTDASGLTMDVVLNITTWQAWKCSPVLHREIWAHDVSAGTLMFRKACWDTLAVYPPKSVGEDADFLHRLLAQDIRLARVSSAKDFMYIRHGDIWPLPPVQYAHMHEWEQVPIEQYLSAEDRAFYRQFASERSSC